MRRKALFWRGGSPAPQSGAQPQNRKATANGPANAGPLFAAPSSRVRTQNDGAGACARYWAAGRAPQNAHRWAATKLVSWAGVGGTRDWKFAASGLNFGHGGRPGALGVPNLAKLVQ